MEKTVHTIAIGVAEKAYIFTAVRLAVLVMHFGLKRAPSMSREIRVLRLNAKLFTGLAQLFPKSTIVKAFVKKAMKIVKGERCFVMMV